MAILTDPVFEALMKEAASPKKKSNIGKSPIWNNEMMCYVRRKRGSKGQWLPQKINKDYRGSPTVRDVLFVIKKGKLHQPRYRYPKVGGQTKRFTSLDDQLFVTFVMKGMVDNAISDNVADVTAAILLYNEACKDRGLSSLVSMDVPVYNKEEATEEDLFEWLANTPEERWKPRAFEDDSMEPYGSENDIPWETLLPPIPKKRKRGRKREETKKDK